MGETTGITWTNHTFNPWVGCTKVSPGCTHCYAETLMDKRLGKVQWGPQGTRVRTSPDNWKQPLKWDRKAKRDGVRRKVFCASLADVFEDHPSIDPQWRADLFTMIDQTTNLDWLLLTKRPENINRMVADYAGDVEWLTSGQKRIWLGTTVENQAMADKRIPELMNTPEVAVKFLSCEPLLGPVNFVQTFWDSSLSYPSGLWVIAGGESGPGSRPMDLSWPLSLLDQCHEARVPFFFKQWGSIGGDQSKHHGGDFLDGHQWHEFPEDL